MKSYSASKNSSPKFAIARTASFALFIIGVLYSLNRENPGYIGVSPQPYLLVSILVGVTLGLTRSLLITPWIAAAFLYFVSKRTDIQLDESTYSPENLLLPLAMVGFSALVGALSDRLRNRVWNLQRDMERQTLLNQDLGRVNDVLRAETSQVERKLASHMQSVNRVFEYAQVLETTDLQRLYQTLIEIVREQLGENNCYIYMLEEKDGRKNIHRVVSRDETKNPWPERVSESEMNQFPLFASTLARKSLTQSEDLNDPTQSGVAAPLTTLSGSVLGFIAIRNLHFLNHVPSTFRTLEALGKWGGMSIARAHHVKSSREGAFIDESTGLFSYGYFKKRMAAEFRRSKSNSLPLNLIRFEIEGFSSLDAARSLVLSQLFANTLERSRREVDVVTQGLDASSFYMILAIASPQEIAECKVKVKAEFVMLQREFETISPLELNFYETSIRRDQKDLNDFLSAEVRQ